jgi:hypothetical protein
MASERLQGRIDALLDEADEAVTRGVWQALREKCATILRLDRCWSNTWRVAPWPSSPYWPGA